jgi:hypothetical protein
MSKWAVCRVEVLLEESKTKVKKVGIRALRQTGMSAFKRCFEETRS